MVTSQWAADIRIVDGSSRFILRVLPLAFLPLQTIDFIGYSGCLICGMGLCISAASRHFLGLLGGVQVRRTPTLMFLVMRIEEVKGMGAMLLGHRCRPRCWDGRERCK